MSRAEDKIFLRSPFPEASLFEFLDAREVRRYLIELTRVRCPSSLKSLPLSLLPRKFAIRAEFDGLTEILKSALYISLFFSRGGNAGSEA